MRPPREDTEPWYRQFWPWFVISLPLSVVIAGIITVIIAFETDDGLVSDDYYKEGLAIHRDADAASRAAALGIQGTLAYDGETGAAELSIASQQPIDGTLRMYIVHPTLANRDQEIMLTPIGEGRYVGRSELLAAADWKLAVEPENAEWRIDGRLRTPQSATAVLD